MDLRRQAIQEFVEDNTEDGTGVTRSEAILCRLQTWFGQERLVLVLLGGLIMMMAMILKWMEMYRLVMKMYLVFMASTGVILFVILIPLPIIVTILIMLFEYAKGMGVGRQRRRHEFDNFLPFCIATFKRVLLFVSGIALRVGYKVAMFVILTPPLIIVLILVELREYFKGKGFFKGKQRRRHQFDNFLRLFEATSEQVLDFISGIALSVGYKVAIAAFVTLCMLAWLFGTPMLVSHVAESSSHVHNLPSGPVLQY